MEKNMETTIWGIGGKGQVLSSLFFEVQDEAYRIAPNMVDGK